MALQSRSGLSSERLGDVAGGKYKYDDHYHKWNVIDNDTGNHLWWAKTEDEANTLDKLYHLGKVRGREENEKAYKEGYEEGYDKGMLKGTVQSWGYC